MNLSSSKERLFARRKNINQVLRLNGPDLIKLIQFDSIKFLSTHEDPESHPDMCYGIIQEL